MSEDKPRLMRPEGETCSEQVAADRARVRARLARDFAAMRQVKAARGIMPAPPACAEEVLESLSEVGEWRGTIE